MDVEEHLVSCLLRTRDMQAVSNARITAEYFTDDQHRRVFEFIVKHHARYGEVPLATQVRRNYPTYRVLKVEHGIDYYVDEIVNQYLHEQVTLTVADATERLEDKDPRAAMRILQEAISDLARIDSRLVDIDLTQTWEERLDEYEEFREHEGKLRGFTTGFPSLDAMTLGIQPEQFIMGVGLPKAGKSTLLLAIALAAHAVGMKVLFIGFEMTNQEQAARYDAMVARIDHLKLLSGGIGTRDVQKLERISKERADTLPEFISSTDITSATTVSGIAAKVRQYKPDLVCIDGVYLMDDENGEPKGSSAALTNISRGLKRLAQTDKVPIFGTTQVLHSKVSRALGVTAASVGYTSAFGQDCNLMIAIEAVEDEPTIQRIKTLLNRIGPSGEFEVEWNWSTGTFQEIDGDDAANAA